MRNRVMFVTSGLERGGAEGFLARLAPRLAARGHACLVVSLGSHGPLAPVLEQSGVPVLELGGLTPLALWRLMHQTREFRPDVIQGWMYRGNLAASLAARWTGGETKLFWSVRQGLDDFADSPALTRCVIRWNARGSNRPRAIVYNATAAARQHEVFGFAPDKTRVIPNGIDPARDVPGPEARASARALLGVPSGDFVIGLFARWHPVKNHEGFARAAGLFLKGRPEGRFLLAGAGVDASNATLMGWLQEAGVDERCLLLGERDDVASLIAALDVATLASHGEAFPNALLEAMAAGIPGVAPGVGDVAELLGDTGVVVARDDPAALAAGWERLATLSQPDRRARGARASERIGSRYGLDGAATAFEALHGETTSIAV